MSRLAVVLRKELTDALRDRRSLLSALLYPLLGPVLIMAMMGWIVHKQAADEPLKLSVVGRDRAPGLVAHLTSQDVSLVPPPADPEGAVRRGELDLVLEIPEDFAPAFRDGRPAPLRLIVDTSRPATRTSPRRLQRLLRTYGQQVGALRLLARGVDPGLGAPLDLREVDVASRGGRGANALAFLPMLAVIAAFVGGMYVATDTTAGERERGSLEPLLLTPVGRGTLALGKWLATTCFGAAALVLTLLFVRLSLLWTPLQDLGLDASLGTGRLALALVLLLPCAPLAAAVQMLVATFARSFKEAQTYLSLLVMLPMLPGVFLSLEPVQPTWGAALIPIWSQQLALMELLRGHAVSPGYWALATATTLATAAAALAAVRWMFGVERVIFGR